MNVRDVFLILLGMTAQIFANNTFVSFSENIPEWYDGPLFSLSQNYPEEISEEIKPWENIDYRKDPYQYLMVLRNYFYEGMFESNFNSGKNEVRTWYDMPWLDVGFHPREFTHGMTRERDTRPFELGPFQKSLAQNWAVAFFNSIGGYTIGRVWKNPSEPNFQAISFPNGTVMVKALFTTAPPEEAPQMENASVWTAYINSDMTLDSPKMLRDLRLMQLDIAVREKRANDTTGWIFGTYIYDKEVAGENAWLKMVPLGLMWGNDPEITPQNVSEGEGLQETVIFEEAPAYAKELLGWAGRMNGPADNHKSSCLSCHSTAQIPKNAPMVPSGTDEEKLKWFRNIKAEEPFEEGGVSGGYSMQMALSIQNFYNPQYNSQITQEQIDHFLSSFESRSIEKK